MDGLVRASNNRKNMYLKKNQNAPRPFLVIISINEFISRSRSPQKDEHNRGDTKRSSRLEVGNNKQRVDCDPVGKKRTETMWHDGAGKCDHKLSRAGLFLAEKQYCCYYTNCMINMK